MKRLLLLLIAAVAAAQFSLVAQAERVETAAQQRFLGKLNGAAIEPTHHHVPA